MAGEDQARTRAQLATLGAITRPMAAGASRLAGESAVGEMFLKAMNEGDSAAVSRIFDDIGVAGVTHRKVDSGMVLSFGTGRPASDAERFPVEVEINIKFSC
jgi:hypothetical protein